MADFALHRAGGNLTLCARTERAINRLARLRAKDAALADRVLLKRDQAKEVLDVLKFEGFTIEGLELM
jgi:hypothetical protein